MSVTYNFHRVMSTIRNLTGLPKVLEKQMLLQGKILAEDMKGKDDLRVLSDAEFSVFSQFGDDGIIQWLVNHLDIPYTTFIEFGVEDYRESNTRFLLMNNNWSGLVMDGSNSNVSRLTRSDYFWKHDLTARSVFINRENINSILEECKFNREVGLLHIDLDGVDYWIWKEISVIFPVIVILEYNSVFGKDRAITVPYAKDFCRTKAHFSNLYWGASLPALYSLSASKGYSFVGCNSAGNNAYFVRTDKLNNRVRESSIEAGYVESKYRESRDHRGRLSFLSGNERIRILKGMPVQNVHTNEIEALY